MGGFEHRPRRTQIRRVGPFAEAAVNRPEQVSGIGGPAIAESEAGKAHGGAQLPKQGALSLDAVLERVTPRFGRTEPRRRAAACLCGLLATIVPAGTALAEVERRVSELTRGSVEEKRANTQVVDGLARERMDGKDLGLAGARRPTA